MQYNPENPQSVVSTNKIAKRFQTVTLAAALANAPLSAIIVKASFATQNVFVDTLPLYGICCGNVFLIAQVFYSLLVQKVEKSLKDLPYREEFHSMSLILRSNFISIFGAVGFLLLTITPFVSRYFLRRRMIRRLLAFFVSRVRWPLVGTPHGVTG